MRGREGPLAGRLAVWRERERLGALLRFAAVLLPLAAVLLAAEPFLGQATRGRLALGWGAAAALGIYVGQRRRRRRVGELEIAAHLDRIWPELEDSTGLLAVSAVELAPLAALQRRRIESRLSPRPAAAGIPWSPVRRGLRWLLLSALTTLLLAGGAKLGAPRRAAGAEKTGIRSDAPEADARPRLEGVTLSVTPPAYTGVAAWTAPALGVEAPEGSRLEWRLAASGVERGWLVLDESRRLELERGADGGLRAGLRLTGNQLVSARLEGAEGTLVTPLARLVALRDRAPALTVEEPPARLELAGETVGAIRLAVRARDDYGVAGAEVVATLATGAGESVRFRERRLAFGRSSGPATDRLYETRLDLAALGLEPGAELYLHVEARDGRQPEPNTARSAGRVIRVAGGAGASVALGSGLPILRLPEFFRSQRQIILDTEKLVADRARLTEEEVARRSQSLGFDQRSLRMRYGGLLGEEFVSGSPVGAEEEIDEHDLETAGAAGSGESLAELLERLPAGLGHQHDAAEITTFFDDRVREQMRSALAEMWGAEGELRGLDPEGALPYEYRALALLKQAQEATRVYVQKVGFEAPPLDPEGRRLSGDLDGIRELRRAARSAPESELAEVREALRRLRRAGAEGFDDAMLAVLRAARSRLVERAVAEPVPEDLEALAVLSAWLDGRGAPPSSLARGVEVVERALWRLLPVPAAAPDRSFAVEDELEALYRRRLREGG